MFESEVFRNQVYCIKESTCDIVWAFQSPAVNWRPHSDLAPGELCLPFPPRYAPAYDVYPEFVSRSFPNQLCTVK